MVRIDGCHSPPRGVFRDTGIVEEIEAPTVVAGCYQTFGGQHVNAVHVGAIRVRGPDAHDGEAQYTCLRLPLGVSFEGVEGGEELATRPHVPVQQLVASTTRTQQSIVHGPVQMGEEGGVAFQPPQHLQLAAGGAGGAIRGGRGGV